MKDKILTGRDFLNKLSEIKGIDMPKYTTEVSFVANANDITKLRIEYFLDESIFDRSSEFVKLFKEYKMVLIEEGESNEGIPKM